MVSFYESPRLRKKWFRSIPNSLYLYWKTVGNNETGWNQSQKSFYLWSPRYFPVVGSIGNSICLRLREISKQSKEATPKIRIYTGRPSKRVQIICLWRNIHYLSIPSYIISWSEPFSRGTLYSCMYKNIYSLIII